MPLWVAEGVVVGEHVGGTCLTCGAIVNVGVDDGELDIVNVASQSKDAGGQGLEPGKGVSPGKRRHRGWGRNVTYFLRNDHRPHIALQSSSRSSAADLQHGSPISTRENGRRSGVRCRFVIPCL